jgi:hypothetical protein
MTNKIDMLKGVDLSASPEGVNQRLEGLERRVSILERIFSSHRIAADQPSEKQASAMPKVFTLIAKTDVSLIISLCSLIVTIVGLIIALRR